MYAIVEIAGKQMKAIPQKLLYTPRLAQEVGQEITLDKVLLIQDGKDALIGAPTLAGSKVVARIVTHKLSDKVLVFKKKRRKGYRKTQGHRQAYTQLRIENIIKGSHHGT